MLIVAFLHRNCRIEAEIKVVVSALTGCALLKSNRMNGSIRLRGKS